MVITQYYVIKFPILIFVLSLYIWSHRSVLDF